MEQPKQVRSYDSDIEETFGDNVDGYQERGYRFARSAPTQYSQDPMPLFLSDPDGEPDPREFADSYRDGRTGRIFVRVLAAVGVAATAAVALTVFSPDAMHTLMVNAKAALPGATPDQSTAAQPAQPDLSRLTARDIQLKDPSRVGQPIVQMAATPSASAPLAAPSRNEITTAYQNALQNRAPLPVAAPAPVTPPAPVAAAVVAPPAAPAPQAAAAAPVRRIAPDELAGLMKRARSLLDVGDITSARLLLERAADAQDASAAFLLAQTYDPNVLGTQDTRNITPDPATARRWYERAVSFGSADAQQRLAQLQD